MNDLYEKNGQNFIVKCSNCAQLMLEGFMACECHKIENSHCDECHGDCRCLDWEG